MAIDFDIRDPKNQKIIMTFLIPVVLMAAFFQFMVRPMREDLVAKRTELNNSRQRLRQIRKSLGKPEELRAEKEELTLKYREIESLLPESEDVAELLNLFSRVEKEANVYLVGFDAVESVEGGEKPYKANKYRMTIEAGYHQFADFVSRLMSLPRIMSFSDLRITLNPLVTEETETYEGMESQPRNLKIECMLTTYLYQQVPAESGD